MQVYKTFFKILYMQKIQIIMYLGIFSLVTVFVSSQMEKNAKQDFVEQQYKVAIFDYDHSQVSEGISEYLASRHEIVTIKEDEKETLQDELYNRNAHCIIRIPQGYGESFETSNRLKLEVVAIPGTIYSDTIEMQVQSYMKHLKALIVGGATKEEAIDKIINILDQEVDVTLLDKNSNGTYSGMYYYFTYASYVLIVIVLVGIGPILFVFNNDMVRNRIRCSSYKLARTNVEIILGMFTTGVVIGFIIWIMGYLNFGTEMLSEKGFLYTISMFSYLLIALALTFLVTQFIHNTTALSMVANVVGVGFSFLGGVFVPIDLMGDEILRISKMMPTYWYVLGGRLIDHLSVETDMVQIYQYIGVQLAYAVAILAIGFVATRYRKNYT